VACNTTRRHCHTQGGRSFAVCLAGQDSFLLSVGQLSLLKESMHQLTTFLASLHAGCSAIIVGLHANKQRGQGNFGDNKSSLTTRIVQACMSAFVPKEVLMLVLEAMPLQQFPLTQGKHEGSKPPFCHPQKYPPLADQLGRLFVALHLQLVRNNMLAKGYPPHQHIKAIVSCGGPAGRRFFTQGSISGHGSLQPDLAATLVGSTAVLPCFQTFHPAALAYKGYLALAHTALAFKQAGLVVRGLQPAQVLAPQLPELQQAVGTEIGASPIRQVLDGSLGLASIYSSSNTPEKPAYIRLSTAFVTQNLDLGQLPTQAQIVVDRAVSPSLMTIQPTRHTTQASGPNGMYKPQQQVRILGLQKLLPLLSLSSKRALVKARCMGTLQLHFRSSMDLNGSQQAQERLQSIIDEASKQMQVTMCSFPCVQQVLSQRLFVAPSFYAPVI